MLGGFSRRAKDRRARMDNEDLHISDFVLVRKPDDSDSVLFLKAGEKFPVSFKRGKWLLPAAILDFGESPKKFALQVLREQLNNGEYSEPAFLSMQSYYGAHWDIVFVLESHLSAEKAPPIARDPFTSVAFLKLSNLPRNEIAEDHLEVLDELQKEP